MNKYEILFFIPMFFYLLVLMIRDEFRSPGYWRQLAQEKADIEKHDYMKKERKVREQNQITVR